LAGGAIPSETGSLTDANEVALDGAGGAGLTKIL
jgi:hypothetical protein